jgi:two-component system response regulator PilR (NtrC family)
MSNKSQRILVVDDELSMRRFLEVLLSREGYKVSCAENGKTAISMINKKHFDLLLCDIRLGDISGLDVLRAAKKQSQHTVVIMISAYASAETAVEAMNEGAYDYVPKPFNNEELKQTIKNALDLKTIEHEKEIIDSELKKTLHFGKIVGSSPRMLHIYDMVKQVAKTKTNILISGESGTGKELIAHAIHEQSDRRDKPFVVINCGGIPENLLESELFGYMKGSFSGAHVDKPGLFEVAHKGTIFLDEIGELPPFLQVKLLRVVQEKTFRRIGSTEDIKVDARIISATNQDLEQKVKNSGFREDLYYRLNVIPVKIPPLRERNEDIPLLTRYFIEKYSKEFGKEVKKISPYALQLLMKYPFPGNVRELENIIERSVALETTNIILPENLIMSGTGEIDENTALNTGIPEKGINLNEELARVENLLITKALQKANGSKTKAAKYLNISFDSLRYRLEKLDI